MPIQVHGSDFLFFLAKIRHFAIKKRKVPKQPLVKGTFWKSSQKITRFQGRKL
jgi:hypothetical protein